MIIFCCSVFKHLHIDYLQHIILFLIFFDFNLMNVLFHSLNYFLQVMQEYIFIYAKYMLNYSKYNIIHNIIDYIFF
jgi:hypothetical protein